MPFSQFFLKKSKVYFWSVIPVLWCFSWEGRTRRCFVSSGFSADRQRCLRGLDKDWTARWQLTDTNAGIVGPSRLVCPQLPMGPCYWCVRRAGLPRPLWDVPHFTSHIDSRQPRQKMRGEANRLHNWFRQQLRIKVEVEGVYLIGGVLLCSDLSPFISQLWQTWITQVSVCLIFLLLIVS